MPGPTISPVGDLYAPFWSLQFFPSLAATQAIAGPPVTRRNSETGEALFVSPDAIYGFSAKETESGAQLTITGGGSGVAVEYGGGLTLQDLNNFRGEMTIKHSSAGVALFDLTLNPPFEIGLEIIDNRVLSREIVILAEWGYVDAAGRVTQSSGNYLFLGAKPGISFSNNSVSIQISGHDLLSSVMGKSVNKRKWNRKEMSDYDILLSLVSELGYRLDATAVEKDSDASISLSLRNKDPIELEQVTSDWIFLKKVASDNKCSLFVGPGEANAIGKSASKPTVYLFATANVWQLADKRYKLRAYEQIESEYDVPLFSFNSQIDGRIFLAAGATSIDVREQNPSKGETEQTTQDVTKDTSYGTPKGRVAQGAIEEATRVRTPVGTIKSDKATPEKGALTISGPGRDSNLMNRVKSESYRQASYANTKADCEIPGMATITPFQLVEVSGMGRTLSGTYKVVSVEHRLGSDGFKSSLSLIRDVVTPDEAPGTTTTIGPKALEREASGEIEEPEDLGDEER